MFVNLYINRNIKTIKVGSSSRAFIIFKVVSLIITTWFLYYEMLFNFEYKKSSYRDFKLHQAFLDIFTW